MKASAAIAVSVGLLVWGWAFASFAFIEPRVLTWITFLTWASFFAAGGGSSGLVKSIVSGIVGVLASAAVLWVHGQIGTGAYSVLILSLLLGTLGFTLCIIAERPLLSCIPASFIGAAAFFGAGSPTGDKLLTVLSSIGIGALLGFISQRLANALTKSVIPAAAEARSPEREGVN